MPTFPKTPIRNTNIVLEGGEHFLVFSSGPMVITSKPKETLSKYKKAGFNLLYSVMWLCEHEVFISLTKTFSTKTNRGRIVTTGNMWYHIDKAVEKGRLKLD